MNILNLYRADKKGNTTMPEKYCTDGLLTKQIVGGDPMILNKYGWVKNIKNHIVKHDRGLDGFIYDTTSFLSFTDDREIVKSYLPKGCEITENFIEANAFIFNFQLDKQKIKSYNNGVYLFEYKCNYEKFNNLQMPIHTCIAKQFIKCNICSQYPDYNHILLLIDAVKYLSTLEFQDSGIIQAYENAKQDSEWLLMPFDPMLDGVGYQSRIPLADFWNDVEHFQYPK